MLKYGPAVLIAAMFALVPVSAGAATIGGEVFGAVNTYEMDDVNNALKAENSLGANFDEIKSGFTGGLGLRMWATPSWLLQGTWEPLFAQSEYAGTKVNLDGNSFQAGVAYYFPSTMNSRYGIGAGVGYYSISGKVEDSGPPVETTDIDGSGVGFHVLGQGEWTVSPGFAITGGAGYRFADIDIDNIDVNGDGEANDTADYSGFMGRLGLAFYLPTASTP
jgi:hypothetical protein